jgi:hypothetical protein
MSEKEQFTIVEFFLQLKSLTNCGAIKGYRKKYAFLCGKTGYSEATIRRRIQLLKEKGLVRIENGNLFLNSKYNLIDSFGYNNKNGKDTDKVMFETLRIRKDNLIITDNVVLDNEYYFDGLVDENIINVGTMQDKLIFDNNFLVNPNLIVNKYNKQNLVRDFHNIKYWDNNVIFDKNVKHEKDKFKNILYAYCINNSIEQQREKYVDKLIQKVLDNKITEKYKGITSYNKKRYSIARKDIEKNLDFYIHEDKRTVYNLLSGFVNKDKIEDSKEFIKSNRNPFFTLSREGVAKCVGFKSKSKGSKIIKRLKELNLIEKDKIQEYSFNDDGYMLDDLQTNKLVSKYGKVFYSTKNNSSMIKFSNNITCNSFNLFSSLLETV